MDFPKLNIKIKFINFHEDFDYQRSPLFSWSKMRNIDFIVCDNPDFVFYSCFGNIDSVLLYPNAVKIFISQENLSPDFIFFDYWIGFDDLKFNRYFQMPIFLNEYLRYEFNDFKNFDNNLILKQKNIFADFIYRHDRSDQLRSNVYNCLLKYKPIVSAGSLLNNTNGDIASFDYIKGYEKKLDIQKHSKFSIIIESTDCDDFITEKIIHSILSHSIPIYFGTSKIFKYFNKNRIIYGYDYDSLENLKKKVVEIDNDDSMFLRIVSEYPFSISYNPEDRYKSFIDWFYSIFLNKKIVRESSYAPVRIGYQIKRLEKNHLYKSLKRRLLKHE